MSRRSVGLGVSSENVTYERKNMKNAPIASVFVACLVVSACAQEAETGGPRTPDAVVREMSSADAYMVDKVTVDEYKTMWGAFGRHVSDCMNEAGMSYKHPAYNEWTSIEPSLGYVFVGKLGEGYRADPIVQDMQSFSFTSLGAPVAVVNHDETSEFGQWANKLAGGYPPNKQDESSCYAQATANLFGSYSEWMHMSMPHFTLHMSVRTYLEDQDSYASLLREYPQCKPDPMSDVRDELGMPMKQPTRFSHGPLLLSGGLAECYDDEAFIKALYEMYEEAYGAVAKARPALFEKVERFKKDALNRAKEMS